MSQGTILEVLRRARKPLDAKEVSKRIGSNRGCTNTSLKKLREQGCISYKLARDRGNYPIILYYIKRKWKKKF